MLAHSVYLTLNDNSPSAIEKLLISGKKYLSGHPGAVFFAIGTLADAYKRPVNDRDFDVALHVIFDSMAAHDQYQTSERHQAFLAENKPNWKSVRVFDSIVEG